MNLVKGYLRVGATIDMHFVIAIPIGFDFDNDRKEIGLDGCECLTADSIPPLSDDERNQSSLDKELNNHN